MRYPKFIESGAAIGFAAPSFGAASEPYRTAFSCALKRFYDWGYKIVPGPNVYKGDGIGISSTPEKCGEELTEMYLSGDVDAIISVGGGELMCETMDYVDLNAIRLAKPKLFMGLSDNTNMVFLLTTLCDTASVYGPCAPAFGQQPLHSSLLDAKNLLEGTKLMETGYDLYEKESRKDEDHPLETYHVTEPRVIRAFVPDGAGGLREADSREEITLHGRLVGGCMDCLTTLTGTRYDRVGDFTEKYRADGILWFLEACDLNVFGIRRAVWELQHAGWFLTMVASHRRDGIKHETLNHLEILRPLGIDENNIDASLSMQVPESVRESLAEKSGPRHIPQDGYLVLCPIGSYVRKNLSLATAAHIVRHFSQRKPIFLIGSAAEAKALEEIARLASLPPNNVLAGALTLPELAAFLENASCLITVDTGPLHIAQAVGCRTVAVFGPTDPVVWGPRGEKDTVLYHKTDCSPCWGKGKCEKRMVCIEGTTAREIIQAAEC